MIAPKTDRLAMLDIHDDVHVEQVRKRLRLDPHYLRRLRHALFQRGRPDVAALEELPADARESFANEVGFHPLRLVTEQGSSLDGSVKRLFETSTGKRLESVVLATPTGRVTLCISSQVGCRAGCKFCATATMPTVTNLTKGEILDQLVFANQYLAAREQHVRNIVFMGMGEPLHNEEAVFEALDSLTANDRFNFSPQKIVLSTVGIPDAMRRAAQRFPKLRFALSLHSADSEIRQQLIPLARKHSLQELHDIVREIVEIEDHHVMIQYLMIEGITDRQQDCDKLLEWLGGACAAT